MNSSDMTHDFIVIGSGPAGMSAAVTAAKLGLRVALLDEQPRAGGQIYRNIEKVSPVISEILGADYRHGRGLAAALAASPVERHFGMTVWDVAEDLTVSALSGGQSFLLRAPQLLAATGAMERASPIPGWTLPGVLNAGAAQIALKADGSVPEGPIILVGGGPLLLLVACQLLDAGTEIAAFIETAPVANRWRALRHGLGALMSPKLLAKGLGMMRRLRRARIPRFSAATELSIEGKERAEAIRFKAAGRHHRIEARIVLMHHGVVPNTQMSRLLRLDHEWSHAQCAWHPRPGAFGETGLAGFRIAGDGGGIAGALAAEAAGIIAALGAAHDLGRISQVERDRLAKGPRQVVRGQLRIRPFLDALYRPPEWILAPTGQVIVCRCEEVSADEVAAMVRLGCLGPNQTKFFSRCGMGPCQGRICGLGVTGILARELGRSPEEVGAYSIRAPLKPVPLAALAQIQPLKTGTDA